MPRERKPKEVVILKDDEDFKEIEKMSIIQTIEEEKKETEKESVEMLPALELEMKNDRAKELVEKKVALYINGTELGRQMRKSYMTVLNWVKEGRIVPDGYVNDEGDFKPNNAIYLVATADALVEEVKMYGKPVVKSEIEGRKF